MPKVLREFLDSKKFWAAVASVVATLLVHLSAKMGLGLSEAQVSEISLHIVGIAAVYIGAQGAADFGKESAKASLPSDPSPPAG